MAVGLLIFLALALMGWINHTFFMSDADKAKIEKNHQDEQKQIEWDNNMARIDREMEGDAKMRKRAEYLLHKAREGR